MKNIIANALFLALVGIGSEMVMAAPAIVRNGEAYNTLSERQFNEGNVVKGPPLAVVQLEDCTWIQTTRPQDFEIPDCPEEDGVVVVSPVSPSTV